MTQETEAPTTTIREELTAALEAAQNTEPQEAQEEVVEEVAAEPEVEDNNETDEIADKVEDEYPLIPKDMSEEERDIIQALLDSDDEEKQLAGEVLIKRYNDLKKGFYNKSKEFAEKTKAMDEINQVFQPFEQMMQQSGVSKAQYMQNMIQWEQALHSRPVETVQMIMQKFGVKPEQLGIQNKDFDFDDEYDTNDNNEIAQLKTELQQLRSQVANQPVQAQLSQFEQATDPSTGELKHPYFKEVAPIMGTLIQTGKAKTLEEAYSKAIKAVNIESSEPEPKAVNVDELKQRIAKARKASKAVNNKGGSRVDYSKMSIREELAARMNQS